MIAGHDRVQIDAVAEDRPCAVPRRRVAHLTGVGASAGGTTAAPLRAKVATNSAPPTAPPSLDDGGCEVITIRARASIR